MTSEVGAYRRSLGTAPGQVMSLGDVRSAEPSRGVGPKLTSAVIRLVCPRFVMHVRGHDCVDLYPLPHIYKLTIANRQSVKRIHLMGPRSGPEYASNV